MNEITQGDQKLSRRNLLKAGIVAIISIVLAACAPRSKDPLFKGEVVNTDSTKKSPLKRALPEASPIRRQLSIVSKDSKLLFLDIDNGDYEFNKEIERTYGDTVGKFFVSSGDFILPHENQLDAIQSLFLTSTKRDMWGAIINSVRAEPQANSYFFIVRSDKQYVLPGFTLQSPGYTFSFVDLSGRTAFGEHGISTNYTIFWV